MSTVLPAAPWAAPVASNAITNRDAKPDLIVAPARSSLFWHEFLRLLRPFAGEELLHLPNQEGACFGLDGREAVFVDQHGLMRHPLRPGFLRHVGVDALAELAGIGQVIEAFGLALQENTLYATRHGPS